MNVILASQYTVHGTRYTGQITTKVITLALEIHK